MKEETIEFESIPLQFSIKADNWQLKLAKSQTYVKDIRQLGLITVSSDLFVPVTVAEEEDMFVFSFTVDEALKQWDDIIKLTRNDKLRLLCNLAKYKDYLSTRITFFLHPDNLVVDDNLMPSIVFRGIRELVPPYTMDEEKFLKQYKCLIIALFSKKYNFDELYSGSLQNVKETAFLRQIEGAVDLAQLIDILEENYKKEQLKAETMMQLYPIKRYRLFKHLTIIMIAVSILLAIPLVYIGGVKLPYEERLLESHREYLAADYGKVIHTLKEQDPEKLPSPAKYILAYSYIKVDKLSDPEKEFIIKNVSLKSNEDYLLYWIYSGRGDFIKAIDLAKYIDDPQLIMYGLIKKIEQDKNNPDLTGAERDEEVKQSEDQLDAYKEKYNLDPDEEESVGETINEVDSSETDEPEEQQDEADKDKENKKTKKPKK